MELKYVKGDLFKVAPESAYLLHACNCQGVWGSGVAYSFAMNYPKDYLEYSKVSRQTNMLGRAYITQSKIICLYTSGNYGKNVSSPNSILASTEDALNELKSHLETNALIYSPKINAGLFRTPWEDTEKLINKFLEARPDVTWVVVEYEP